MIVFWIENLLISLLRKLFSNRMKIAGRMLGSSMLGSLAMEKIKMNCMTSIRIMVFMEPITMRINMVGTKWQKGSYTSTGSNGWKYENIRTIQYMLDNIDDSKMTETEKNHWKGVCYFFKANEYFSFLSRFGKAIWVDKVLTDADEDILYGPTISRVELAGKILEMLEFARDNVKKDGDGKNTVTPDVVNALISRFGLFEGTWEKYHNVEGGDPAKYLQASFDASSALVTKYPMIHSNYNELFNSYDLSGVQGVLLYKIYIPTKGHDLMRVMRSSESWQEASSDMVQSYLCRDGKPIWTSSEYEGNRQTGNDIMNVEFRNRDHRLYYSIVRPLG